VLLLGPLLYFEGEGTHWIGGWVGSQSQSGHAGEEKILPYCPCQELHPGCSPL